MLLIQSNAICDVSMSYPTLVRQPFQWPFALSLVVRLVHPLVLKWHSQMIWHKGWEGFAILAAKFWLWMGFGTWVDLLCQLNGLDYLQVWQLPNWMPKFAPRMALPKFGIKYDTRAESVERVMPKFGFGMGFGTWVACSSKCTRETSDEIDR